MLLIRETLKSSDYLPKKIRWQRVIRCTYSFFVSMSRSCGGVANPAVLLFSQAGFAPRLRFSISPKISLHFSTTSVIEYRLIGYKSPTQFEIACAVIAVIPGLLWLTTSNKTGTEISHCHIIVTLSAGCVERRSPSAREALRLKPTNFFCRVIP